MVFKVSLQVHINSWHRKYRIIEAKVGSYMDMHPVFNTTSAKAERCEYEGLESDKSFYNMGFTLVSLSILISLVGF